MWDLTDNRFNRLDRVFLQFRQPSLRSVIRRPCSVASLVVNDKQINGEFGAVPACGLPSSILRRGSGSTANSSSIRATIGVETREPACLRVLASNYSEPQWYIEPLFHTGNQCGYFLIPPSLFTVRDANFLRIRKHVSQDCLRLHV